MAEENTVSAPKRSSKGKMGSKLFNILLVIALLVVAGLFIRAEKQRHDLQMNFDKTNQELEQVKNSTQGNNQEAANATLAAVRKLIDVPTDPAPTVATITDVDSLRKTNDFYKNAVNGDNLIITATRAILYDPVKNIIVD
ncbi:MAG: hypothetical protein ABIP54_03755, partial [Candidatus Andersenbacteria bacterium]